VAVLKLLFGELQGLGAQRQPEQAQGESAWWMI
jgi:hypothetical protein